MIVMASNKKIELIGEYPIPRCFGTKQYVSFNIICKGCVYNLKCAKRFYDHKMIRKIEYEVRHKKKGAKK